MIMSVMHNTRRFIQMYLSLVDHVNDTKFYGVWTATKVRRCNMALPACAPQKSLSMPTKIELDLASKFTNNNTKLINMYVRQEVDQGH